MSAPATPTKAELVQQLRDSGDKAVAALSAMPMVRFEEGRYENGWNGRQILAHMASIEWTYPRLIELAQGAAAGERARSANSPARSGGGSPAGSPVPQSVSVAAGNAGGTPQILSYNDRQVEKRAGVPVPELIAEFQKNRAAFIAAVEATDEALFAKPIKSAGGAEGPLAAVIRFVAVDHVLGHTRDIAGEAAQ